MKATDILIFLSDQHAAVYGTRGRMSVDTPNLDRLCENGTSFEAAYTPCPLCVPARMALLSGLSPKRTGIYTNNDTLPQTIPTFLHAMAAAGYETVLCGRMHFLGPDQRHGFTKRIAPDFTPCGWTRPIKALTEDFGVHLQTMGYKWCRDVVGGGASPVVSYDEMVLDSLESYLSEPHEKPQLIVVGTYGPHFPYVAPAELFMKYLDTAKLPPTWPVDKNILNMQQAGLLPKEDREELVLACQAAYKGLVENTDRLLGRARKAFEDFCKKRGRGSLFAYISDHGDMVGEHGIYGKKTFFEASARVPMIFSGDGVAAGRRVSEPVSLIDIGPTICSFAEVEPLSETDGRSLDDVLKGESADAARIVESELIDLVDGSWTYTAMLRQGNYKYIACHRDRSKDQLFDVIRDPYEQHNLFGYDSLPESLHLAMEEKMEDCQQQEKRQLKRGEQMKLLASAEIASGVTDPERFHNYPPEDKLPPRVCVTDLAGAPGFKQKSIFIGLPKNVYKEGSR